MLASRVSLHDIEDVWDFVQATLHRQQIPCEQDEREELAAEGLTILYALAAKYEQRRGGHPQDGRFSGFAAYFLPKKLLTAWHRLHPEHRYVTSSSDGKRFWLYLTPSVSLDAEQERQFESYVGNHEVEPLPVSKWIAPTTVARAL